MHSVRVLPFGTTSGRTAPHRPETPAAPGPGPSADRPSPSDAPADSPEGYLRARAVCRTHDRTARIDPHIQAAVEKQRRERMREPEELFGDGRAATEELRARATRPGSTRESRDRALRRRAAERAGLIKTEPAF